jgi:hypothetical protein
MALGNLVRFKSPGRDIGRIGAANSLPVPGETLKTGIRRKRPAADSTGMVLDQMEEFATDPTRLSSHRNLYEFAIDKLVPVSIRHAKQVVRGQVGAWS